MSDLAKTLIFFGIILIGSGLLLAFFGKIPGLGRLPGDIYFRKGNFVVFFPLATCLLASVLLTLVFSIFGRK